MTGLFVGLYGIYLIMVGLRGNAGQLLALIGRDAPKYLPWLLAIVVLAFMSQYEATEKVVKPFIILLILAFFLKNYTTVENQLKSIWKLSGA